MHDLTGKGLHGRHKGMEADCCCVNAGVASTSAPLTRAGSRDWTLPPESMWPANSTSVKIAVETPFLDCDEEECDITLQASWLAFGTADCPAGA